MLLTAVLWCFRSRGQLTVVVCKALLYTTVSVHMTLLTGPVQLVIAPEPYLNRSVWLAVLVNYRNINDLGAEWSNAKVWCHKIWIATDQGRFTMLYIELTRSNYNNVGQHLIKHGRKWIKMTEWMFGLIRKISTSPHFFYQIEVNSLAFVMYSERLMWHDRYVLSVRWPCCAGLLQWH